jgi:acyl carrier protein
MTVEEFIKFSLVQNLAKDITNIDVVNSNLDDLEMDSIEFVSVIVDIEHEYGIHFGDIEFEFLDNRKKTIKELIEKTEALIKEKESKTKPPESDVKTEG